MAFILANLHSFIIYSYVGTAIILALTYILIKLLKVTAPKLKAAVYFAALAVPPLTYAVVHITLDKPCTFGRLPWSVSGTAAGMVYSELCRIGANIAEFLVPFFGAALIIGSAKGLISIIACRRLISHYGYLTDRDAPDIFNMLQGVVSQTDVKFPKVILTHQNHIKAFTFGINDPVIVISEGVLKNLTIEELEHVLKHECAHIKRYDVLTNWLAVIIRDISFFNPFAIWAFSLFTAAKEEASDDIAVINGSNPYAYGATLIKMWRMTKERTLFNLLFDNVSPNPGFLKKAAAFEERVKRMLQWQDSISEPKMFYIFLSMVIIFSITVIIVLC